MGAYNDDVLFIHIPKCGGTAVKHYMDEHLPDVRWQRPTDPASRAYAGLPIGHVPLCDIEAYTNRPPESFKKILAVVRDPFTHQVSQWKFWKGRYEKGNRHIHDAAAAAAPTIHTWLEDPLCDFHVWYEENFARNPNEPVQMREPPACGPHNLYTGFVGYFHYWLNIDGAIPDNVTVLRQETLAEDLPIQLAPFADHELPPVPVVNESQWASDRLWSYYWHGDEDEMRRAITLVEEKFQWVFGGGAYPVAEQRQDFRDYVYKDEAA